MKRLETIDNFLGVDITDLHITYLNTPLITQDILDKLRELCSKYGLPKVKEFIKCRQRIG